MKAIEDMTLEELKARKLELEEDISKHNNMQMAFKILLNSAYGALGSPYFRMYDTRIASGITLSGQLAIKHMARHLNNYLGGIMGDDKDRVAAIDTDSSYIIFDDVVNKFMGDKACDKDLVLKKLDELGNGIFQKEINKACNELAKMTNAHEVAMQMKREAIGAALFVQKKRYVMKVYDNEGVRYADPKLKVMGLEAVRSTIPQFLRDGIKTVYGMMFDTTELEIQKYVNDIRKKFESLPLEDIAYASTAGNLDTYTDKAPSGKTFAKATPKHIKGAITFNRMLDKEPALKAKYEPIRTGDKIRVLELYQPNPFMNSPVISFKNAPPPELDVWKYTDHSIMFDKLFIKPLERVMHIVKWHPEMRVDIENILFG